MIFVSVSLPDEGEFLVGFRDSEKNIRHEGFSTRNRSETRRRIRFLPDQRSNLRQPQRLVRSSDKTLSQRNGLERMHRSTLHHSIRCILV